MNSKTTNITNTIDQKFHVSEDVPQSRLYRQIAGDYFIQQATHHAQIESAEEERKRNLILLDIIEKQQEANHIQRESNVLMKQQIEFLQQVNLEQEKQLKKQRARSIIAWIITTIITLVAAIAQFG